MQEVQHRVANSLQIIASVLMQSAGRVQSEEARGHLQNAHHRVMSIARPCKSNSQPPRVGNVELRTPISRNFAKALAPRRSRIQTGSRSGIVEALARNLGGEIQLSDADPGTAVTINHRGGIDLQADLPTAA
jgi:two-component sensor histidine kinase